MAYGYKAKKGSALVGMNKGLQGLSMGAAQYTMAVTKKYSKKK